MREQRPNIMSTAAPDLALARSSARPAVVSACLLMLAALVDSQVVAAITPQVAAGLRSAPTQVAASVTSYAGAAATVALLAGRPPPPDGEIGGSRAGT